MGWYDGMDTEFARRLEALIAGSGGRISVGSGYRSIEKQTELWNNSAQDGYMVAAPGKSNHNFGVAADLGFDGDAEQWAHENASRYGLEFPMSWEPWHIEPVGLRDGLFVPELKGGTHDDGSTMLPGTAESYTNAPAGQISPVDAVNRYDLGYQLASLNSVLMSPNPGELDNPNANVATAAEPTNRITGT